MQFSLPRYHPPAFEGPLAAGPDAPLCACPADGILPDNFHATSVFPEYVRIGGVWKLIEHSRMDCCITVRGGLPFAVEARNIKAGDPVVVGRTEDGSEGVLVHTDGFEDEHTANESFAFRMQRSRETSYSRDYDGLYALLEHEREHGNIVWVLGPVTVFDHDSRNALQSLAENGYMSAVFAGNAVATHDLEAAYFRTALGQDIYTQELRHNGHYHHLEIINRIREAGSIRGLIERHAIGDGLMAALEKRRIPYVLAGSVRDDGPLPEVIHSPYAAQDAMRALVTQATTVIALATQLHTIATGNMTPSYTVRNGAVRPVYFYTVDISEFAVNKLRDRGSLGVRSIVTNIQDFLVNLQRGLRLA